MVLCCVVGCSKRSGRDKVSFFRIPAVITHRASHEKELSERRFRQYLAIIGRGDLSGTKLSNARICSRHFVSGSPADLFDDTNIDGLPTRCLWARGRGEKVYQQVVDRHDRHTRRMQAAGFPGQTKSSNRRKGKKWKSTPEENILEANDDGSVFEPSDLSGILEANEDGSVSKPSDISDLPLAYAAELDDLQPEVGSRNAVSFPNAATQTEIIGNKLDEKDEMLSRLMAQHRQLSKFVDSAQHFSERFFLN